MLFLMLVRARSYCWLSSLWARAWKNTHNLYSTTIAMTQHLCHLGIVGVVVQSIITFPSTALNNLLLWEYTIGLPYRQGIGSTISCGYLELWIYEPYIHNIQGSGSILVCCIYGFSTPWESETMDMVPLRYRRSYNTWPSVRGTRFKFLVSTLHGLV